MRLNNRKVCKQGKFVKVFSNTELKLLTEILIQELTAFTMIELKTMKIYRSRKFNNQENQLLVIIYGVSTVRSKSRNVSQ